MDANANTMDILIASDLHLGFKENDPIRGNDSFDALKEILQIAKAKNVDFILLGGDLFHLNKPSKNTLYTTLDLFQHFCLGKRPCKLKILSDQALNFGKRHASNTNVSVNYENPNISISMPVFSIHGNHDDNTGINDLSAIDILSVAGLLNHFGKQEHTKEIEISPVVLRKGTTTLALYGLGSIRDVHLYKLFKEKKVTFKRSMNQNEMFNIFVLNQNRAEYNEKSYVPEKFLEDFFDLIIWGHKHECKIEPEQSRVKNFKIMQPGSTVATQMHESETKPKHVAILRLNGKQMKVKKIPLRTVRQMYIDTIVLSEVIEKQTSAKTRAMKVKKHCRKRIEELLTEAEGSRRQEQPEKPLIQLKINYSGGFEILNQYQFGDEFKDKVANPENVVQFLKQSLTSIGDANHDSGMDMDVEDITLEDLVQKYLQDKEKQLRSLNIHDMTAAVDDFVNKKLLQAIFEATERQIKNTKQRLKAYKGLLDCNEIAREICRINGVELNSESNHQSTDQPPVFNATQSFDSDSSSSPGFTSNKRKHRGHKSASSPTQQRVNGIRVRPVFVQVTNKDRRQAARAQQALFASSTANKKNNADAMRRSDLSQRFNPSMCDDDNRKDDHSDSVGVRRFSRSRITRSSRIISEKKKRSAKPATRSKIMASDDDCCMDDGDHSSDSLGIRRSSRSQPTRPSTITSKKKRNAKTRAKSFIKDATRLSTSDDDSCKDDEDDHSDSIGVRRSSRSQPTRISSATSEKKKRKATPATRPKTIDVTRLSASDDDSCMDDGDDRSDSIGIRRSSRSQPTSSSTITSKKKRNAKTRAKSLIKDITRLSTSDDEDDHNDSIGVRCSSRSLSSSTLKKKRRNTKPRTRSMVKERFRQSIDDDDSCKDDDKDDSSNLNGVGRSSRFQPTRSSSASSKKKAREAKRTTRSKFENTDEFFHLPSEGSDSEDDSDDFEDDCYSDDYDDDDDYYEDGSETEYFGVDSDEEDVESEYEDGDDSSDEDDDDDAIIDLTFDDDEESQDEPLMKRSRR